MRATAPAGSRQKPSRRAISPKKAQIVPSRRLQDQSPKGSRYSGVGISQLALSTSCCMTSSSLLRRGEARSNTVPSPSVVPVYLVPARRAEIGFKKSESAPLQVCLCCGMDRQFQYRRLPFCSRCVSGVCQRCRSQVRIRLSEMDPNAINLMGGSPGPRMPCQTSPLPTMVKVPHPELSLYLSPAKGSGLLIVGA